MAKAVADRSNLLPERTKLHAAMLVLQFIYAAFHIVSREALNMGVSKVVFPVYRNTIALSLLAPFAYFLEKITANQGCYLLGLYYASPTFASAMQNSVPAITFALAASLKLEKVNILRRDGVAKVVGTIACVGGATIITLYKGPPLLHMASSGLASNSVDAGIFASESKGNWTMGCIYLFGNCLAWSGWIVLQAPVLRKYPARLTVTSFTCFFGVIQFLIIASFIERDVEHWKIQSGGELFTILYAVTKHKLMTCILFIFFSQRSFHLNHSKQLLFQMKVDIFLISSMILQGFVASGIGFSIQTWCIDKGGPVFVAVYQPVQTVAVAFMATIILGDQLYSGGIVGAILIVAGLYSVLWGKNKERKIEVNQEENACRKPLLAEDRAPMVPCELP
ncbi:Auxin-induced protein 5NG4 [Nymphaea thermarum]|nr:Auxin-induced protein 5NG4 [Nymphaea thermarum]